MRRIGRLDWTCGLCPPTLVLHVKAAILTRAEARDEILTIFSEKFRPIYWARLRGTAVPVAGILNRKGIKPHGQGKGNYSND